MNLATFRQDIQAIFDRDPAARNVLEVLLFYPGLHALWFHRLAHALWRRGFKLLGRGFSHVGRLLTGIEIHPGAQIGPGFFIDHGMATVIGETAEIGPNVTLYHNVTLGGVSWEKVKRHPTLQEHVVVGAGAQILGPITIGAYSRIGANSVVVKDVPPHSVVVGIPGRIRNLTETPPGAESHEDLQHNRLPDVTMEMMRQLNQRLLALEQNVIELRPAEDRQMADVWAGRDGDMI